MGTFSQRGSSLSTHWTDVPAMWGVVVGKLAIWGGDICVPSAGTESFHMPYCLILVTQIMIGIYPISVTHS